MPEAERCRSRMNSVDLRLDAPSGWIPDDDERLRIGGPQVVGQQFSSGLAGTEPMTIRIEAGEKQQIAMLAGEKRFAPGNRRKAIRDGCASRIPGHKSIQIGQN